MTDFIINDGTVIAVTPHGDGTGTQTTYEAGEVVDVETLTMPVADAPVPADEPLHADLLANAEAARRAAYDAVIAAGNGVMSMARLRDADRAGSEAFLTALAE